MCNNLLHASHRPLPQHSNALEDPWAEPPESMFTRSVSPEAAPDTPTYLELEFERGDPVAIDGVRLSPASLLARLNELAGVNGIGRIDIVESRFVGMKSRGVYETPGGTILYHAHRAIESICLDRFVLVGMMWLVARWLVACWLVARWLVARWLFHHDG